MPTLSEGHGISERLYGYEYEDGTIREARIGRVPEGHWEKPTPEGAWNHSEWPEARTTRGFLVSSELWNSDGCRFTIYSDRPLTKTERERAKADIRSDRDAVGFRFRVVVWAEGQP